ncbi:MAG TPA: type II toxin-antitoxin system RelE/ParE family toxin, partial [Haloferula sp.]
SKSWLEDEPCSAASWKETQVAETALGGMSATFQFVRAAEAEYFDAIRYYAEASGDADVAVRFVAAIEEAVGTICAAPAMWRIVDPPQVRRYVVRHFLLT